MRWGVVTFPGSNDDRDALHVVERVLGDEAVPLWHKDRDLHGVDCIVLPGGFSYGDYLRCGAMAKCAPVMESVARHAAAGGLVLGICNGFQVLCEAGLLPGALVRNRSLSFVCDTVTVRVETTDTPFTHGWRRARGRSPPARDAAGGHRRGRRRAWPHAGGVGEDPGGARPYADHRGARHLRGHVVRALLLQELARVPPPAADDGPAGAPGS